MVKNTLGKNNIANLLYEIKGLGMAAAILHTGAHPDDEDVGLITYLTCKYGARVVYWSATRGEGGQNHISLHKNEALGIIRTWESISAGKIHRGECLYGPFYDYGYSKNADDTFKRWEKEQLVREIVRAIRKIQPHILVSRWFGTEEDFHGHHQAVGIATLEAFNLAGDPKQFKDLEKEGLFAWQPQKLYISTNNSLGDLTSGGALNLFGKLNPLFEKPGYLKINTGEYDNISQLTYQQKAWLAYNSHISQVMQEIPKSGDFFYYFKLHQSHVLTSDYETSIFDGLDPTIAGLADYPGNNDSRLKEHLKKITLLTNQFQNEFQFNSKVGVEDKILTAYSLLCDAYHSLNNDFQSLKRYLSYKIGSFEETLAKYLGIKLEALSDKSEIFPGQKIKISTRLWNYYDHEISELEYKLQAPQGWQIDMSQGDEFTNFDVTSSKSAALSVPYWLSESRDLYKYHWTNFDEAGSALGHSPLIMKCSFLIKKNYQINLSVPVINQDIDESLFRESLLTVLPPISLHPIQTIIAINLQDNPKKVELELLINNFSKTTIAGPLHLKTPVGWEVEQSSLKLPNLKRNMKIKTMVNLPDDLKVGQYYLQFECLYEERSYNYKLIPIQLEKDGFKAIMLEQAIIKVIVVDVILKKDLKYAYLPGSDNTVFSILQSLNLDIHLITRKELSELIDFKIFDTILVAENAYIMNEEVHKNAKRLLEYVHDGGCLIVQNQGYRYENQGYTPFPFKFQQPHARVTNENAPIMLLQPNHSLFNIPNKITVKDFDYWVINRGFSFFNEWDSKYTTLLSSADPNESQKAGGLCLCNYGQGMFLYTGYSFHLQLPAGVQGAFRLFSNILALPYILLHDRIEFLKKIPVFDDINIDQLFNIAKLMEIRFYNDKEDVCKQGDTDTHEFYIIQKGQLDVIELDASNHEIIIHTAKEGEYEGETAILGGIARTATLRARGELWLLVLRKDRLFEFLNKFPTMYEVIIKNLIIRYELKNQ